MKEDYQKSSKKYNFILFFQTQSHLTDIVLKNKSLELVNTPFSGH